MEQFPTLDLENLEERTPRKEAKSTKAEKKHANKSKSATNAEVRAPLESLNAQPDSEPVSDTDSSDTENKTSKSNTVAIPFKHDIYQIIRGLDYEPSKYPKCIDSHVDRKFFKMSLDNPKTSIGEGCFSPESSDHCALCLKLVNPSEMVNCKGFMEGFIGRGKNKVRCKSVFHLSCILNYNASDYNLPYIILPECQNEILCPLHFCDTCYFERRKQTAFSGDLIECALCMRSFHYDKCAPIGGKDLELTLVVDGDKYKCEMVICPAHCTSKNNKKFARIPGCCECEKVKDEDLVKCIHCVRSFHPSCRSAEEIDGVAVAPDICEFCLTGECIRYDTPVVARWRDNKFYPAFTRDWSKCPNQLRKDNRYDQLGYCTLEWQGGNNYSIASIGECVPMFATSYNLLSDSPKMSEKAKEVWRVLIRHPENFIKFPPLLKEVRRKTDTSKYMYKHWEKNGPFVEIDKYICDCPPNAPNRCSTDACSNQREYYECPQECNEKGKCFNRGISEKEVNPNIERRATAEKGYGVFAKGPIKKGEFIAEYAGEIINKMEIDKRNNMICNARDNEANLYMMALGQGRAVDAARLGNIARYINHSCDPNCQTVKRSVIVRERKDGILYDHRIAIVAIRDIAVGEEISFTYLMDVCVNTEAPRCKCGAQNCRGSLDGTNRESPYPDTDEDSLQLVAVADVSMDKPKSRRKSKAAELTVAQGKKNALVPASRKVKRENSNSTSKTRNVKKARITEENDETRDTFASPEGNFEVANERDRKGTMIMIREMVGRCCAINDPNLKTNELKRFWDLLKTEENMDAWLFSKVKEEIAPMSNQFQSPIGGRIVEIESEEVEETYKTNNRKGRRRRGESLKMIEPSQASGPRRSPRRAITYGKLSSSTS